MAVPEDAPPEPARVAGALLATLERAATQSLRRVFKPDRVGPAPWPAHPRTLASLVRRGLLVKSRVTSRAGHPADQWDVTAEGLRALEPVRREERVRWMAPVTGSTTEQADSIDPDAPLLGDPEVAWARAARERHQRVRPARRRRAA